MTVHARCTTFPPLDLAGKRVLVTGDTLGIGAAIAAHAARAGADVLVAARARADEAGTARFVKADLSNPRGVSALAEDAEVAPGGVDVLVDNVGNPTHPPAAAWDMSDEDC